MLTSKQRAQLRGLANGFDPVLYIGKGGVTDTVIQEAEQLLTARELIKGAVLENAPQSAKETAQAVARQTGADVVQVVGRKMILYRQSEDKDKRSYSLLLKRGGL